MKMDLTLYNLQWLICHKTKPNQNPSCPHSPVNFFLFVEAAKE